MAINKIYEDFYRVLAGTLSSCSDIKSETSKKFENRLEKLITKLNLVRNDKVEFLQEMLSKVRIDNDDLKERVKRLEAIIKENK